MDLTCIVGGILDHSVDLRSDNMAVASVAITLSANTFDYIVFVPEQNTSYSL